MLFYFYPVSNYKERCFWPQYHITLWYIKIDVCLHTITVIDYVVGTEGEQDEFYDVWCGLL